MRSFPADGPQGKDSFLLLSIGTDGSERPQGNRYARLQRRNPHALSEQGEAIQAPGDAVYGIHVSAYPGEFIAKRAAFDDREPAPVKGPIPQVQETFVRAKEPRDVLPMLVLDETTAFFMALSAPGTEMGLECGRNESVIKTGPRPYRRFPDRGSRTARKPVRAWRRGRSAA
jgi:hypothetical protein